MIVSISRRGASQRVKIALRLAVAAFVILYVLPGIITLFWNIQHPAPRIRDEQFWEKPLRVISEKVEIT